MEQFSLRRKAQRMTRFVIVQFIALLGWIFVQLFFFMSPIGQTFTFGITLIVEAIWWMGLLMIMLLLFLVEYNHFVKAAVDLEDANNRLRRRTNAMMHHTYNITTHPLYTMQVVDGREMSSGEGERETNE